MQRKLTKNVSRRANPLIENGTSITRKSSGPITKNGRGERSTPTALAASQIVITRTACRPSVAVNAIPSTPRSLR